MINVHESAMASINEQMVQDAAEITRLREALAESERTVSKLNDNLEIMRAQVVSVKKAFADLAELVGPRAAGFSDVWSSVELLVKERTTAQETLLAVEFSSNNIPSHGVCLCPVCHGCGRHDPECFLAAAIARIKPVLHTMRRYSLTETLCGAEPTTPSPGARFIDCPDCLRVLEEHKP